MMMLLTDLLRRCPLKAFKTRSTRIRLPVYGLTETNDVRTAVTNKIKYTEQTLHSFSIVYISFQLFVNISFPSELIRNQYTMSLPFHRSNTNFSILFKKR